MYMYDHHTINPLYLISVFPHLPKSISVKFFSILTTSLKDLSSAFKNFFHFLPHQCQSYTLVFLRPSMNQPLRLSIQNRSVIYSRTQTLTYLTKTLQKPIP